MKPTWTATYDNNKITVENTWFKEERLYVNDILQEIQRAYFPRF